MTEISFYSFIFIFYTGNNMQFLKTETVLINFNNYKYNFLAQLLKYSNDKWLLKRMNLNERKLKS